MLLPVSSAYRVHSVEEKAQHLHTWTENILRCIDVGEQEIMRECARGYLLLLQLLSETETCNSQDLLYRNWCEYTKGAIPK